MGCGRGGGSQRRAPGTEPAGRGVGPETEAARSPRGFLPTALYTPSLRPGRGGTKRSGLRAQALPGLRCRLPSLPHRLSASRDPACVPAGSPPALQPRPLRAARPAPRPFPPAGHAHPEDEVEKHQHGLGGGDATLAHGAGGRLRPCSASGTRSPSEVAMATAPPHRELQGPHPSPSKHLAPTCSRCLPNFLMHISH